MLCGCENMALKILGIFSLAESLFPIGPLLWTVLCQSPGQFLRLRLNMK
jgi:hypothetical protein